MTLKARIAAIVAELRATNHALRLVEQQQRREYSRHQGELTNPADIATVAEWGRGQP